MSSVDDTEFINPDELITYIFPDFNAIKYFQRDFINTNEFHLLEENVSSGFDIYLVEQWVLNRKIGTIISTYTGNMESKVAVIKLTVLKKPVKSYPLRFQEYLNELMLNHAKIKKMDNEIQMAPKELLFVTNSASLPSNLNLITIPTGDIRLMENDFIVNSNLKKLHCSGRSLSLFTNKISGANEDKFRHVYKIYNLNVPIKFAIKELVNLIQMCLFYFDLLDAKYCDGLLCNKTEESISEWWNLIGLPHYSFKPNIRNGILPSRTIAAVISLVLSVKIRLQMVGGCDVPKDPFDFENFMLSIGQFQRQFKLDKLRKLDLQTLNKLFTITNAKIIPEKSNFNYDHNDEVQPDNSMNPSNLNSNLSSPYKKNKNYYSKEFKKFTNVVKNTVQDHIIAPNKDSDDAFQNMNPKSSGRIRNRIAKLADNVSPLDVETLDLEVLVKNYLCGKVLPRLWFGTYQSIPSDLPDSLQPPQLGHHHHRHHNSNNDSKSYRFISLKDAISHTQSLPYYTNSSSSVPDASKYSRGFNKMKLGLQNRKLLVSSNTPKKHNLTLQVAADNNDGNSNSQGNSTSMLDSFLTPDDICPQYEGRNDESSTHSIANQHYISKFKTILNRRNSYPFVVQQGEMNLNVIEFSRHDIEPENNRFQLQRSLSCSLLEDYFCSKSEKPIVSIDKLSSNYLNNVNNLVKIENIEKNNNDSSTDLITTKKIENLYNKLNHEIITFNHMHNQVINNKNRILEGDLVSSLNFNLDDLSATIDRLVYETRIVGKRINEFEENSNLLDSKLNTQSMKKLSKLIDNLIYLNRFNQTFDDMNEKKSIISELTGEDPKELNCTENSLSKGDNILRILIIFIYEFLSYIFQVFNLDRSKMNFDRISQTWKKVDPNKKYINKIYSIIGKDPSKTSLSKDSIKKNKS